jgi:hypothetical protein
MDGSSRHLVKILTMIYRSKGFEEGVTCLDCGLECEAEDLNRCSLDAYADLSVDYDLFCPQCHQDNLKFHRPKEDH